jgi:6-phosphogluconolactonase
MRMKEDKDPRELIILPDADSLARTAAERFIALAKAALAERGRFRVALSGGSTPLPTYELLAREPFAAQVDWEQVHFFWGDERCVPPDHPESNYRAARAALLDEIAVSPQNIHPIPCQHRPTRAARLYQEELETSLGPRGAFDLILLGMGTDGHTASLFPDTTALAEQKRWVTDNYTKKLKAWRVTLTLPAINRARQIIFMVSGATKASTLARVWAGEPLPAGMVQPASGRLTWLIDQAAASDLRSTAWKNS